MRLTRILIKFYREQIRIDEFFLGVIGLTAYIVHGLECKLPRDNAIYYYSAQQLLKGVPPYVSIFDIKTPMTTFFSGIGVGLANLVGFDELIAVRLLFITAGLFTIIIIYRITIYLWRDRWTALVSCLIYLSFDALIFHTVAGSRPKVLVLFFEVCAIYAIMRKSWTLVGILGALAALTWQPASVILIAGAIYAVFDKDRKTAFVYIFVGAVIPIGLNIAYFVCAGALQDFVEGSLIIHLTYFGDGESFCNNIRSMKSAIGRGYPLTSVFVKVGFVAFFVITICSFRRKESTGIVNDRMRLVALVYIFFVFWSFIDFQSYPDWFPLLPFVALGFARAVAIALRLIERNVTGSKLIKAGLVLACVVLVFTVSAKGRAGKGNFRSVENESNSVLKAYGAKNSVVSIGAPAFLALTKTRNPSPYIVINSGIDRYVDAKIEGGIQGWVDKLEYLNPKLIVMGQTEGELLSPLFLWVKRNREAFKLGEWMIWVKHDNLPLDFK
jgi:hypothetical protein